MKLSSFSWVYGFNQIIMYMNSEIYHEKPTGNSHGSPKPNQTILRSVEVVSCTAAQREVLNVCGALDMTQLLHPLSLSLPLASSNPHHSRNCFLLQTALWSSLACTNLVLYFCQAVQWFSLLGKGCISSVVFRWKFNFSLKTCFSALMCASNTAGCLFPRSLLPAVFCSRHSSVLPCPWFLPGLLMGAGFLKSHSKGNQVF